MLPASPPIAMRVLRSGISERLVSGAESWQLRMEKLKKGQFFGRFFAAGREKLEEVSRRLNVGRVGNLVGCPAR
jgi:hypothetical protein